MRVLFIYQFLTLGGVESVVRNRYLGLKRLHPSVEVEALFLSKFVEPQPGLADRVTITSKPTEISAAVRRADVVSVIDTPQVFEWVGRLDRPLIVEVHSAYDESRRYLRKPLPPATQLVLVPSRAFQNQIEHELPKNAPPITHLYNPLDPACFASDSPRPENLRLRDSRPLLWVGRFDELKDWRRAVGLFASLLRKCDAPELEPFFIGRHLDPGAAASEFRTAGLLGRVRHVHAVPFHQMPGVYQMVAERRGLYLSTSQGESFGMTVAEAMAAGLPCVIGNLPAFREVTGGEADCFGSDAEAVAAVRALLEDPVAYSRASKRLRAQAELFRPDAIAGRLHGLLRDVLAGRAGLGTVSA